MVVPMGHLVGPTTRYNAIWHNGVNVLEQPVTPSLDRTDQASQAVQKTPNRVSLESIKAKVGFIDYFYPERHPHMTICLVTMTNGFVLVGKSAPADPANFDRELGCQFAFEDALKQAWPLEAYLLRERLTAEESVD